MNTSRTSTADLIGILFLYLKLTGEINWSWWWVTLPFYGSIALTTAVEVLKKKRNKSPDFQKQFDKKRELLETTLNELVNLKMKINKDQSN